MSKTFDRHPFECSFYYPHTATLATATASVTLKAPERGDRRAKSRSQNFARLKNGSVIVYDMGTNLSDMLTLPFEMVPQVEFASLLVFLEYVVWGANKVKYIDYKGDEYIVRIYKNTIDAVNKGEADLKSPELTQYDFTLELIDVTTNVADTGQTAVPTQLALHLADTDHPHNPLTVVDITTATPTIIESINVDDYRHVSWMVSLVSGTFSKTLFVHAVHNGTVGADATTIGTTTDTLDTVGTDPADITVTTTLTGAGVSQVMNLSVTKAAGSVTVSVRRVRI
jgi:hypothetical protein